MSSSRAGYAYEKELVRTLYNKTDVNNAIPAGYSGNHAVPASDVHLCTTDGCHEIEAKKTSQTKGIAFPNDDDAKDEPRHLAELTALHDEDTMCWFLLKISRRQPLLVLVEPIGDETAAEAICREIPQCFNPRVGSKSGNLIVDDPWEHDKDSWPSATSGKSELEIISERLGLEVIDDD